jgi:hypothetical protein
VNVKLLLKQTAYSRGVNVQFRNEEESRAFHCTFEQRKKEALQGAASICSPTLLV